MIIIDTHIWLWLLHDPTQLSNAAQEQIEIEEPQNGILVSAISVWEIAVKSSLGKLALSLQIDDWYALAKTHSGIVIEPLNPADAISSTQLPGDFHKDPADRIIVAMARRYNVPLITCDNNILKYPHVKTIW